MQQKSHQMKTELFNLLNVPDCNPRSVEWESHVIATALRSLEVNKH